MIKTGTSRLNKIFDILTYRLWFKCAQVIVSKIGTKLSERERVIH